MGMNFTVNLDLSCLRYRYTSDILICQELMVFLHCLVVCCLLFATYIASEQIKELNLFFKLYLGCLIFAQFLFLFLHLIKNYFSSFMLSLHLSLTVKFLLAGKFESHYPSYRCRSTEMIHLILCLQPGSWRRSFLSLLTKLDSEPMLDIMVSLFLLERWWRWILV